MHCHPNLSVHTHIPIDLLKLSKLSGLYYASQTDANHLNPLMVFDLDDPIEKEKLHQNET